MPGVSVLGRAQPAAADRRPRGRTRARRGTGRAGPPGPAARRTAVPGTGAATGMHSIGAAQHDHGHDLADVVGQHVGADGGGGGRGRRTPPLPRGSARARARRCSPSGCRPSCPRSAGRSPLEVTAVHSVAGLLPPGKPLIDVAALLRPAPLGHDAGPRRRRPGHRPARSGLAGPPRGALPGRDARVQQPGPGRPAAAAGGGARRDRAQRGRGAVPGEVPDGARGQPLPVRPLLAAGRPVRVPALGDPALPGPALRAAARPGRPAGRGGPRHPHRADRRRGAGASPRRRSPTGCGRPGSGRPTRLAGTPWRTNSEVPGPRAAQPLARRRPARWTRPSGTWSGAC